jgi:hypothetical protein
VFIDDFSLCGAMEPVAPSAPCQRRWSAPSPRLVANGTIKLAAGWLDHGERKGWTFL